MQMTIYKKINLKAVKYLFSILSTYCIERLQG